MIFKGNNKDIQGLKASFGKLKEDSFDFDLIERYFKGRDNSGSYQVLSGKIWNDLDLYDIFKFLDRTYSKVGQQFLFNKLKNIPADLNKIQKHEEIIREFTEDPDLRLNVQRHISKLNNFEAFYITSLFQEEHLKSPGWFFAVPVLAFISLISLILLFFIPQFFVVFIGVLIINIVIH